MPPSTPRELTGEGRLTDRASHGFNFPFEPSTTSVSSPSRSTLVPPLLRAESRVVVGRLPIRSSGIVALALGALLELATTVKPSDTSTATVTANVSRVFICKPPRTVERRRGLERRQRDWAASAKPVNDSPGQFTRLPRDCLPFAMRPRPTTRSGRSRAHRDTPDRRGRPAATLQAKRHTSGTATRDGSAAEVVTELLAPARCRRDRPEANETDADV
jgi:hypothetical protein